MGTVHERNRPLRFQYSGNCLRLIDSSSALIRLEHHASDYHCFGVIGSADDPFAIEKQSALGFLAVSKVR